MNMNKLINSRNFLSISFRLVYGTNARYCTKAVKGEGFVYIPKFSSLEQEKILNTINKSNLEQLSQFNVSRQRLKSLETWKNKRGPFQSLSDMLEVDGLGVKVLERLCESIISNNEPSLQKKKEVGINSKNKRSILTPPLSPETLMTIKSAVGLHLDPTGVSWTKLLCNGNKIETWDFYDYSALPKRMLPVETFNLAVDIVSKLPTSDVYIFEAMHTRSPTQQNQTIAASFTHQQELTSMLLSVLNMSPAHNSTVIANPENILCQNKVHFLRSKVPARLFKTLVGNEKVSATSSIVTLLENSPDEFQLPCSRISVSQNFVEMYGEKTAVQKDLLGQSLLLVVSFMDLCVIKNPISLRSIAPGNRNS